MVVLVFWATYGKSWVLVSTLGSRKSQIFIMLAGPCFRVLCPTSDMGPGSQASILRKCLGSRVSLLVQQGSIIQQRSTFTMYNIETQTLALIVLYLIFYKICVKRFIFSLIYTMKLLYFHVYTSCKVFTDGVREVLHMVFKLGLRHGFYMRF